MVHNPGGHCLISMAVLISGVPPFHFFMPKRRFNLLGCPGQEDRINGERINGLFHLLIYGIFLGVKSPTDPNLLVTSWDIQSGTMQKSLKSFDFHFFHTARASLDERAAFVVGRSWGKSSYSFADLGGYLQDTT